MPRCPHCHLFIKKRLGRHIPSCTASFPLSQNSIPPVNVANHPLVIQDDMHSLELPTSPSLPSTFASLPEADVEQDTMFPTGHDPLVTDPLVTDDLDAVELWEQL